MGRRSWGTLGENEFLEEDLANFMNARSKTQVATFFTSNAQSYFTMLYPEVHVPEGADERKIFFRALMPDKDGERPLISVAKRKEQIKYWYYNRCNGTLQATQKKEKKEVDLDFSAPKKTVKRQAYQAYVDIYGERVLPIINAEFAEYKTQPLPEGEKRKGYLEFMGMRGKAMLAEESEEVKAAVEAARLKLPKDDGLEMFTDPAAGLTPQDKRKCARTIQERIDALAKKMQGLVKSVEAQLGWKISVVAGGPHPDTGAFVTQSYHAGKTANLGLGLPEASSKYAAFLEDFGNFVVNCYPPDTAKKLHEAYQEVLEDDTNNDTTFTSTGESSTNVDNPPDPNIPSFSVQLGPSPASVSSSRASQSSSRASQSSSRASQSSSRASQSPSEDPVEERELSETDALPETDVSPESNVSPEPNASAESTESPGAPGEPNSREPNRVHSSRAKTPVLSYEMQRQANLKRNQELFAAQGLVGAADSLQKPKKARAPRGSKSALHPSPPTTTTDAPLTTFESPADKGESPVTAAPGVTSLPSPTSSETDNGVAGTGLHTSTNSEYPSTVNAASPPDPTPSLTATTTIVSSSIPSDTTVPSASSALSAPLPVPLPSSSSPPPPSDTRLAVPVRPGNASSPQKKTLTILNVDAPEWVIDAVEYFEYFVEEGGDTWVDLVMAWQAYEMRLGYPESRKKQHHLPTALRPDKVAQWMKEGRDYEKLPELSNAAEWVAWWVSLQPSCRRAEGLSTALNRVVPADKAEWELLWRGGPCGFFLVVMALAWWLYAASEEGGSLEDVSKAISDVLWVCTTVMEVHATPKRAAEGETSGAEKRPRLE